MAPSPARLTLRTKAVGFVSGSPVSTSGCLADPAASRGNARIREGAFVQIGLKHRHVTIDCAGYACRPDPTIRTLWIVAAAMHMRQTMMMSPYGEPSRHQCYRYVIIYKE